MIAFHDEFLDAQLMRTMAHASYRGAELGECLAAAATIRPGDRDSWLGAWLKLADRTCAAAEASERGGHGVSARDGYLRASNYYRNAYILHLEAPLPGAVTSAYRRHRDVFARAAALMPRPLEPLAIPFETGELHGYFCAAGDGRRPLVIAVGGYDSTAEEGYFFNAAAATARGYHCVIFDGPGQGTALLEHGQPFRPDWEHVISAVIDGAVGRPDVDPTKIVLIGESFGGYLAPRGAARDWRVAACVVDPPQISLFRAARDRVPGPASLKARLPDGPRWLVSLLRPLFERIARKKPTGGWVFRRGMLTHGVRTAWDYFVDTARYDNTTIVGEIRCPMLVCDAAGDDISAYAGEFHDALTCDKELIRFTADEGAADHCVMGNRGLYHQRVFDWLDTRLAAPPTPPPAGTRAAS